MVCIVVFSGVATNLIARPMEFPFSVCVLSARAGTCRALFRPRPRKACGRRCSCLPSSALAWRPGPR
eukprot:3739782-Heterocapsa_arctica.AAC.1